MLKDNKDSSICRNFHLHLLIINSNSVTSRLKACNTHFSHMISSNYNIGLCWFTNLASCKISEVYAFPLPESAIQHSHCTSHYLRSNLPFDPTRSSFCHKLIFDIQPSAQEKKLKLEIHGNNHIPRNLLKAYPCSTYYTKTIIALYFHTWVYNISILPNFVYTTLAIW